MVAVCCWKFSNVESIPTYIIRLVSYAFICCSQKTHFIHGTMILRCKRMLQEKVKFSFRSYEKSGQFIWELERKWLERKNSWKSVDSVQLSRCSPQIAISSLFWTNNFSTRKIANDAWSTQYVWNIGRLICNYILRKKRLCRETEIRHWFISE